MRAQRGERATRASQRDESFVFLMELFNQSRLLAHTFLSLSNDE